MKKKVLFAALATLVLGTSTAMANVISAPLNEGEVVANVAVRKVTPTVEANGNSFEGNKLNSTEVAVAVGITRNLSASIEYVNYGSYKYIYGNGAWEKIELYAYDVSGRYQVAKNVNALGGFRRLGANYSSNFAGNASAESKNYYFVGASASQELDKDGKTNVYGSFKVGNDSWNELVAGVNCKVTSNIWLDANYKATKYGGDSSDLKLKGWAFGATYKF